MDKLRVHGAEVSYFTGKLEGYLRYKEIPYELVVPDMRVLARETGAAQIPAIELADGRWLTDTTPILHWLETQHPKPEVIPADPLQGFFSKLVEDYADEWMWRPAMHYRWSYKPDSILLRRRIAEELGGGVPLPGWLKRFFIYRRQLGWYVKGDAVTRKTRAHVESVYLKTLAHLQVIFERRPFMLGRIPTLADFGFFASMWRHFALDPTASAIMRRRAPAVSEWTARLWNARASGTQGSLVPGIPEDWSPLLNEIGSAYLPYLCENAEAWKRKQKRFDAEIQGVPYRRIPMSRYRVWCLERLRANFQGLPSSESNRAQAILEAHGCWEPLWRVAETASGIDPENRAPFARSIRVHYSE
ncbi:MAG: glutathione S-transferase family protein [bacterium]|nr:glutathione S-transferase family protein [bacterium]